MASPGMSFSRRQVPSSRGDLLPPAPHLIRSVPRELVNRLAGLRGQNPGWAIPGSGDESGNQAHRGRPGRARTGPSCGVTTGTLCGTFDSTAVVDELVDSVCVVEFVPVACFWTLDF